MEKNEVLRMMREKLEFRNYSSKTIKSYLYIAEDYLDAYPSKQYIREDDIRSYILSKKDKGLAPKTNFMQAVLRKGYLPEFINQQETQPAIQTETNQKVLLRFVYLLFKHR